MGRENVRKIDGKKNQTGKSEHLASERRGKQYFNFPERTRTQ
jgi:hypothetical protein